MVKKVYNNDSSLKEAVYYVDENFVRVVNISGSYDSTYVKHNGQMIAELKSDSSKIFIHSDHLGSFTVVTDESGAVIENTSYSLFGEVLSGGQSTRFGYEGKEYDSVVGDTDFNFRKYKAKWALFTQPDSLIQNVFDPQMLNRYAFERNNPYKYEDNDGHFVISTTVGLILAFVAGFVEGLVVANKTKEIEEQEEDISKFFYRLRDDVGKHPKKCMVATARKLAIKNYFDMMKCHKTQHLNSN